jgi:hypothetical protein
MIPLRYNKSEITESMCARQILLLAAQEYKPNPLTIGKHELFGGCRFRYEYFEVACRMLTVDGEVDKETYGDLVSLDVLYGDTQATKRFDRRHLKMSLDDFSKLHLETIVDKLFDKK